MKFAEKLSYLRTQNNLSQEDFAQLLDVSRQTVSKWENGLSYPEIDKLIFISNKFQVSLDYLLKDSSSSLRNTSSLDRLTLEFLGSAQDIQQISQKIVTIMRDGIIDRGERMQLIQLIPRLESIMENIAELKKQLAENGQS